MRARGGAVCLLLHPDVAGPRRHAAGAFERAGHAGFPFNFFGDLGDERDQRRIWIFPGILREHAVDIREDHEQVGVHELRNLRREGVVAFAAKLPACTVAMEACCGAHHLGRLLVSQGHEVRLMSPEYVRPYVKAQKNDDRDAEAIAEAATRPTMRFVALKSEAQLDVQTLHRVRDQLVGERTALMNQVRAILLERGHVVAQGRAKLAACLAALLDTRAGSSLTPRMRTLVAEVRERWQGLDRRIAALDAEFAEQARDGGFVRARVGDFFRAIEKHDLLAAEFLLVEPVERFVLDDLVIDRREDGALAGEYYSRMMIADWANWSTLRAKLREALDLPGIPKEKKSRSTKPAASVAQ